MDMVATAGAPDLRVAGIYYFLTGVVFLLICFVLYFLTPRLVSLVKKKKYFFKKNSILKAFLSSLR
jgi:hypothetical protein